jgi:hypothetical protein
MHCVVQSAKVTLMKAGPHTLNFFHYPEPYIENLGFRNQVNDKPGYNTRPASELTT